MRLIEERKKQLLFFLSHKTSGLSFLKVETFERKIQKIIQLKYKAFSHVEYYLQGTRRSPGETLKIHKIF